MSLFKRRKLGFEREAIRIAHRVLGSDVAVEQHPEIDAITFDDVQLNLTSLRERYSQLGPTEAHDWLLSALGELLVPEELPDSLDEQSALMPGLRSRSFVESHRLTALQRDVHLEPLATRPITENLVVGILWDQTHSMISLHEAQIAAWGETYDGALDMALRNLEALPIVGWAGIDDRMFRLIAGDEFVSARILTPSIFDRLPLGDDIVVCVPTRGDLFASATDDVESLETLFELSRQTAGTGAGVSLRPLRYAGGVWSELTLEQDHPAYFKWRMLSRLDRAQEADSTRSLLQHLVGGDIFVGSVIVREDDETGMVDTVSVWSEGVPTLLATADLVAFPRSDHDSGFVTAPWRRVQSVLGHRMTATVHYPERWLVESFPSREELANLVSPR
jgi:hypothetical protein